MLERNKDNLPLARELRKNLTPQETKLWYRFLKQYPLKFYKQKLIGACIVDFYCDKAKLVIEIDGSQHYSPEEAAYDAQRTAWLNRQGLQVIRFSNREVNLFFREVCEKIHMTICQRLPNEPPNPF